MTDKECISGLEVLKQIPHAKNYIEHINMSIKAIDKIGHLIDRPCEACEFHKENGCCKWSCVFEEVQSEKL